MAHPVDVHVGRKLKQIRTTRRMSQTDVAKQLDLSFQQIQKYEIGSNRIAASRLYELSRILDVSTSYFFEGLQEEDINPNTGRTDIMSAVASIKDESVRSRIVSLIEDVSGMRVARQV